MFSRILKKSLIKNLEKIGILAVLDWFSILFSQIVTLKLKAGICEAPHTPDEGLAQSDQFLAQSDQYFSVKSALSLGYLVASFRLREMWACFKVVKGTQKSYLISKSYLNTNTLVWVRICFGGAHDNHLLVREVQCGDFSVHLSQGTGGRQDFLSSLGNQ